MLQIGHLKATYSYFDEIPQPKFLTLWLYFILVCQYSHSRLYIINMIIKRERFKGIEYYDDLN